MVRICALWMMLLVAPACAQPPEAHEPKAGALFDEGAVEKVVDRVLERRVKKMQEDAAKDAEQIQFDSDGNVVSDKKGFAALAIGGIVAIIVKKIIMAMLWAYVIHTLMGYWWVAALFFLAVFLVSFIGGRIGGRTVRS